MYNFFGNFSKNIFMQNFIKLFSATLFAQIFTIALSPILTRLYSPEDFGYFSVYTAIVSLAIVYATGRFEFAISTTKTIEESENLLKLVVILSIVSSILMFLVVIIFEDKLIRLAGFNPNNNVLYYIPLTIIVLGIMQGLNYYFNRLKDFSHISKSKVFQSISNGGSSVLFAFLGFHTLGMIWANILGILFANLYNVFGRKLYKLFKIQDYDFLEIKRIANSYKYYPLFNSTSAFFDVLALQAPVLILNRFFSEVIVGFYSLTVRVIALPVSLISGAVSQVYLSELAEKENNGERIDLLLEKVFRILSLLGLIPLIILIFLGPVLFEFIFGNDWREAGKLAQILAFSYYAKFVVSPLSVVFFVKKAVRLLSIIQFGRAVSTIIILLLSSIYFKSIILVVITYSVHEVLFYFIYYLFIIKVSKA